MLFLNLIPLLFSLSYFAVNTLPRSTIKAAHQGAGYFPLLLNMAHTDLHISVEADGGHKDPVQVLKGSWAMLFLIDVEGQCAFSQIQQDTHSRALSDASLCPTHTHTHKASQFCYVYVP